VLFLISICISTYNGSGILKETLDSIFSDIDEEQVAIVISDEWSTDKTSEIELAYSEKHAKIQD